MKIIGVKIETWRTIDNDEDKSYWLLKHWCELFTLWWIFNINILNIILPRHPGLFLSLINNEVVNNISNIT